MKGELFRFYAGDGVVLHGFLCKPKKPSKVCILNVHGLGGSFYGNSYTKVMANTASSSGVNFFAISLRGSYDTFGLRKVRGKSTKMVRAGGNLEKFEDCLYDIEGAIKFLREMGMKRIFLEGHSTGCQKVTYYQYRRRDRNVKGLILLAPAEDLPIYMKDLKRRFTSAVKEARITSRKGPYEMMPQKYGLGGLSARRFLSLTDTRYVESRLFHYDSDRLKEFHSIKVPILAVFGSKDPYTEKPVREHMSILSRNASSDFASLIIEGADHGFSGKERQLARGVLEWIKTH